MSINDVKLEVLVAINDKCWLAQHTMGYWKDLTEEIIMKTLEKTKTYTGLEVSILLTNNAEIHSLNLRYRGKDKPTNVLSFPTLSKEEIKFLAMENTYPVILGDIVLSFEKLIEESRQEGKIFLNHFNHLVVHGMLHLLGYDHECDEEEKQMKEIEIEILNALDISNPYQ